MNDLKVLRISFITLFVAAFFVYCANVSACSITNSIIEGPDGWFNENWSFNDSTIPNGVSIQMDSVSANPRLIIVNESDIPLYIISGSDATRISTNSELPKNIIPNRKYINSIELVYLDFRTHDATQPYYRDVALVSGQVPLKANDLESLGVISKNIYSEKTPPKKIQIPTLTPFTFPAYYGANPIQITGTISYQRNTNFIKRSADSCSSGFNYVYLSILSFVVILIIVLVVTTLWWTKGRKETPISS